MNKKNKNQNSGFSLIEVLISVGILVVMMLMLTKAFQGVLRSQDNIKKSGDHYQTIYGGLLKLYNDFHMAFLANTAFHGQDNSYLTAFIASEEKVDFSTMSHIHFIKNRVDTDQIHVGYLLRKNEDNDTFDLVRRETDYLRKDIDKGGESFVLIPDLKTLSFEYYDADKESWKNLWDTESISFVGRLPQKVRIKLEVYRPFFLETKEEEEREVDLFEFMIPVAMYANQLNF